MMKKERLQSLVDALEKLRMHEDELIREIQAELFINNLIKKRRYEYEDDFNNHNIANRSPQFDCKNKVVNIGDRVEFSATKSNCKGTGIVDGWTCGDQPFARIKRDTEWSFGTEIVLRKSKSVTKIK